MGESYRGHRRGEELLSHVEQHVQTEKFFITTNLSNHRTQKLMLRMQYVGCGYIDQLDPGDPELVFVKRLCIQSTT